MPGIASILPSQRIENDISVFVYNSNILRLFKQSLHFVEVLPEFSLRDPVASHSP
jgi:hypothetical protein